MWKHELIAQPDTTSPRQADAGPAVDPARTEILQAHIIPIIKELRKRRIDMGLSQSDVDQMLGTADRLCGKWEAGVRTPTSYSLALWAQGLGCKLTAIPTN